MNYQKQKEELVALEVQENKHKTNGELLYDANRYAISLMNTIEDDHKYNLKDSSFYDDIEELLNKVINAVLDKLERL